MGAEGSIFAQGGHGRELLHRILNEVKESSKIWIFWEKVSQEEALSRNVSEEQQRD